MVIVQVAPVAPGTATKGLSPFEDISQVKPVIVSPAVVATLAAKVALLVTNAIWLVGWTTMLTLARARGVPAENARLMVAKTE